MVENESHLLQCKMLLGELEDANVEFEFVFKDVDKQMHLKLSNLYSEREKSCWSLKIEENH